MEPALRQRQLDSEPCDPETENTWADLTPEDEDELVALCAQARADREHDILEEAKPL